MHNAIELCNVGYLNILNNISITIKGNELITVIGPNGAGKTSLLKIIAGIKKPTSGKVKKSGAAKIGYMPQKIKFNPALPISVKCFLTLQKDLCKEYLYKKAQELGILNLFKRQIHHLSGGEVQKVLFLSAIANKPDLLVLDEPANHLDLAARQKFYSMIEEQKTYCSVVIASHDVHVVMRQTERVICINKSMCCVGCSKKISSNKDFIDVFGYNLSLYMHDHTGTKNS